MKEEIEFDEFDESDEIKELEDLYEESKRREGNNYYIITLKEEEEKPNKELMVDQVMENKEMENRKKKNRGKRKIEEIKRKISCAHCNYKLSKKNRFCTKCGNQLNKGIYDNKSKIGTIIEKWSLNPELYSHLKPIPFLPRYLTEPIYCVGSFAADLKPEDYHAGFSIHQVLPEKTAFFFNTTPKIMHSKPMMLKLPPRLSIEHYHDYGNSLFKKISNTNSLKHLRGHNFYIDREGNLNQLCFEGGIIYGGQIQATLFFAFFKEIKQLKQQEIEQLGVNLVPKIEILDDPY